ncbi:MAG: hypothetical protein Q9160_007812 [Pyrenula sp. 1 TL-2023]
MPPPQPEPTSESTAPSSALSQTKSSKPYNATLLPLLLESSILSFGTFTLKSGRSSPYFFTSSALHTARQLNAVSSAIAYLLSQPPFVDPTTSTPAFDVVFGPAYKGIPLAAAVMTELAHVAPEKMGDISYAFNRKEAKAHGEGGSVVGAGMKGKRVLIIDDVITAGTALREAVDIIRAQGGILAGVVVLLDRQERVSDEEKRSAVGKARHDLHVPVQAVIELADLIEVFEKGGMTGVGEEEVSRLKEYREKYGSVD